MLQTSQQRTHGSPELALVLSRPISSDDSERVVNEGSHMTEAVCVMSWPSRVGGELGLRAGVRGRAEFGFGGMQLGCYHTLALLCVPVPDGTVVDGVLSG